MLVDTIEKVKAISFDSANLDAYVSSLRGLSETQARVVLSSAGLDKAQKQQILNKLAETSATVGLTTAEATAALTKKLGSQDEAERLLIKAKLVTQEQLLAGATIEVTSAKIAEAIATDKITEEEGKKILSAFGLTGANTTLGASFKLLATTIWESVKAMAAWLFTTPAGWTTLTIGIVVGAIAAYNKWGDTVENATEKLEESKQAYQEVKSELESVNNELKTTKDRIKELEGKDTLTFTEKEELDNLKKRNNELGYQNDLLEEQNRIKNKEKNKDFVHLMDKKSEGSVYTTDENGNQVELTGKYKRKYWDDFNISNYLSAKARHDEEAIDTYEQQMIDRWEEYEDNISGMEYITSPSNDDEEAVNEWLDFAYDYRDRMMIALGADGAKQNAFNRVVDNLQFDKVVQGLQDLGEEGKVTAKMLDDPKYDKFIQKLVDLGIIDTADNLDYIALAFNNIDTEVKTANKNLDEMTVSLSELEKASDNIKPIGAAFKELSDDGYITIKTLKEIKDAADLSSEEWVEYEAKLLKAKIGSSEFNQIMSDLTYKILDNTFANENLNNLTEQQITAILRENGVVNASAVAHEWLTNAKIKNKLATFDFANASQVEFDKLSEELKLLGLTETAVGSLSKAYAEAQSAMLQVATTSALSRLRISQDELKGVKSVADAYKLMAGKSYDVNGDGVGDFYGSEKNRPAFDKYRDQYNADVESVVAFAKAQEEIDKIINNIDVGGTTPDYSGADKSDKNEVLDNYLKDAENRYKIHQDEAKYIQELQYAYDNLTKDEKERLDITGKINEAYRDLADNKIKDVEHQIDLVKELNEYTDVTDYYKQIQKISHEEASRLRSMGYDDNSNEIQDLQKKWWSAQKSIADWSYSNSERWISERNTYNDWELYGDNEIAAWERVLKRFKTEFSNELEKIKDIEQKIFEARKTAMEKSISDIEDYINARNTYNDWDAYGDSEVKAIQRQTKIIEDMYNQRLLSYEEYIDRLEEQSQRIYSLGQSRVDKHLSDIDKYIDARNFYNDWDDFGDSEINAIEKQLKVLKNAYRLNLISYEDYTERFAEYTQKLYSVAKDNIIEEVSKLIEDYEEMKNLESSQLESQKTLLQSYYDVTNAIADAQHEINKELKASMTMYEYLDEETRELLFNQEDYNLLNEELLEIQLAADELQKQYQEDILNASAETIAEITSQYQMQYETMMKQYEIAKAELDVAKKRQQLDNVLAERNTRMFINGQWQWVAKTQDVINAQNELAEAEINKKKQEASLEQTEAINSLTAHINSLETDLAQVRKYWADMQEMLNGEADEVSKALKEISKVSSPELKRVINATGGSITSFSGLLSESTETMSDIIDGDRGFGTIANSISSIITDLEGYSDAIQRLINKINGVNSNGKSTSDIIAEMMLNSEKWHTASDSEKERLALRNQELGDSIGADYDSATGKWYSSDGKLLYSVSSSIGGSSSSSKGTSSSSGKTVQAGSDGNAPAGTKVGDTVKTAGGDYLVVAPNTKGANYNPASGLWSIKIDEKDADGTRYTSGGMTLMGEEGFEAFISNNGRLIPIAQPTIGNIGAGGIVFNREQMAGLRNLWDWSNLGNISPFTSSLTANKQNTTIDNSIHINGLTISEQGNEDWINGLRRYVATHK